MQKPDTICAFSTSKQADSIRRIIQSALNAADSAAAIRRFASREETFLTVSGRKYDLSSFRQVHLLSIGKAGCALARALDDLLGRFLSRGLVITKTADQTPPGRFTVIEGGHPVPDERSLAAGQAAQEFLVGVAPDDLLLCAISGGGSALVAAPIPPVTLADLQALTFRLLSCGASINEINTIRRHLDTLKGGGFLHHTTAPVISLILSDVIGNALEAIASGPTAPDHTTHADALSVLEKYGLRLETPSVIITALQDAPETLKPGALRLETVQNVVIGSNLLAAQSALKQAAEEGYRPYLLRANLAGEAREVARELCQSLRWACQHADPVARPFCMVAGGETTVTIHGNGRGGRNTELALAAVNELVDFPDVLLMTLATDGEDGPTDAAGAVVTGETWRRAEALGLHPLEYLNRNDSYTFFSVLGDLLKIGSTGTNVNDLVFLFGF